VWFEPGSSYTTVRHAISFQLLLKIWPLTEISCIVYPRILALYILLLFGIVICFTCLYFNNCKWKFTGGNNVVICLCYVDSIMSLPAAYCPIEFSSRQKCALQRLRNIIERLHLSVFIVDSALRTVRFSMYFHLELSSYFVPLLINFIFLQHSCTELVFKIYYET